MQKQIFAIYFPSWHSDAQYAKWYGQGFSEWELRKSTKPLFTGHKQPKELGFEAVFAYNIVQAKECQTLPDARLIYDYPAVIESQRVCWNKI